jgi:hypothetical protein
MKSIYTQRAKLENASHFLARGSRRINKQKITRKSASTLRDNFYLFMWLVANPQISQEP